MRHPLYVTLIDQKFFRSHKDGVVNWTNTKQYSVLDIQTFLDNGKEVHLIPHTGDEHGEYLKPDYMRLIMKDL